jgi:Lrp/AsnC family leucine-responsive transcriptional regulator
MLSDLDEIDRDILRILQDDARSSNQELARRVGLSPSPCWRRVRRLEESGYIQRYVTLLEPEKLGFAVLAFAQVALDEHSPEAHARFEHYVQSRPEVLECHAMTGPYDYLLKIVVHTIQEYDTFVQRCLVPSARIRSVNSSFVLRRAKNNTALPLEGTSAANVSEILPFVEASQELAR